MKNIKYYMGALLLTATALTGCQDDFDAPGLNTPQATLEPNTTILDIKNRYWNDATNYIDTIGFNDEGERVVIAGRVVSSDASGNIYKNLVIQDNTAAITLSINANSLYNDYRIGQEIVIDLTDMYIGKYNALQQLGFPDYDVVYGWQATFMPFEFFKLHSQLNGLPEPEKIDTLTTTIAELPTNPEGLQKWQSQLVRFNNVHFEGGGTLHYTDEAEVSANRTLIDSKGNSITVRNSGYARFYADVLPAGSGDVVGILSYYGTSGWQILLRSTDDCMNFGNPTIDPGTEDNPYTVPQAIAKEAEDASVAGWVTGYIVGAVAPEVETITSSDDIEWGAPSTLKNTLVIAPSADVKDINQCLVTALPQDSKLREYANLVDNPSVLGRQIWLLGTFEKYLGSWGITGNRGTIEEFRIEGVEISDGSIPAGDGYESTPYNVPQVQSGISGTSVWVAGYIVGWVDGMTLSDGATFSVPATSKTNLLLANTPTASSVDDCIPVQLPTSIRNELNLQDNPTNIGRRLAIKGNITKYFGVNGVKEATEYKLEGASSGGETPAPSVDPVTSLNETFEGITSISELQGWTSKVVAGNKAWYFTDFDNNTYAACTAYKGTDDGNGYDSWLITPPLDLNAMSNKTFSFESQAAYSGSPELEVYVMTAADPAQATLSRISCTVATAPASGYSGFVSSGNISLEQYTGIIYIGFRYTATTSAASMTYCIDNVKVGIDSTPETPEYPVDPTPPATGENSADFNTFNGGSAKSSPYATYTTEAGWTADNSIILGGTSGADANPLFSFIGTEGTLAPCLNGKTTAPGKLTSPTLTGGVGTLSFKYGFAYSDTKCKFTVNILQNGAVVKSQAVELTSLEKKTAYDFSMEAGISGDFTIEIVNDCLSGSASNKDRVAIWNLSWTSNQ